MLKIIYERKHEHSSHKINNLLFAQDHETRSRVYNKLVFPRYLKSKWQNALTFRDIKSRNTTPNDGARASSTCEAKKKLQIT